MQPPLQAVLVGATGLVGSALLRLLLTDPRFGPIVALGRRRAATADPAIASLAPGKLEDLEVRFDDPRTFAAHVRGDVLFSALGTTIRAAGSQEAQRAVDHGYQLAVARAARENGVPALVLVSAAGASPDARIFYSRMKGELERDVEALRFPRARILRPGMLDGPRREHRAGERLALGILRPLAAALPAAARPIHVETVARAAIAAALDPAPGLARLEAADLFRLGAAPGG